MKRSSTPPARSAAQPLHQARRPPVDDAILIGRLIDRPIRPLWPKGYRNEVQGVATVLSMDPAFRPDMIAMIAMSAAFMLTGAPFEGPVAGLRLGLKDGKLPPSCPRGARRGDLDLVVAGTKDGIMMVEAGADEVPEEQVIEGLAFAQEAIQPAIQLQKELVKKSVSPSRNTNLSCRTRTSRRSRPISPESLAKTCASHIRSATRWCRRCARKLWLTMKPSSAKLGRRQA
jgi:polyribonucleotide nucleotidyltransferase